MEKECGNCKYGQLTLSEEPCKSCGDMSEDDYSLWEPMEEKVVDYQKQIDNIMDYFEFNRVARTMELLNWKWASVNGVPNEGEIRQMARRLLKETVRTGGVATGGFRALRRDNILSLEFVLEEWESTVN